MVFIVSKRRVYFTPAGFAKIKQDLIKAKSDRPQKVQSLKTAREMGDLSENAAYKVARQELSALDRQIRHLERLIRESKVAHIPIQGIIGIGTKVTLTVSGKKLIYTIAGSYESDPLKGIISHISPMGKALMGKKAGQQITFTSPLGIKTIEILSVN